MDRAEPLFKAPERFFAIERLNLTTLKSSGPADGFLIPSTLHVFSALTGDGVEQALRDSAPVVLG